MSSRLTLLETSRSSLQYKLKKYKFWQKEEDPKDGASCSEDLGGIAEALSFYKSPFSWVEY